MDEIEILTSMLEAGHCVEHDCDCPVVNVAGTPRFMIDLGYAFCLGQPTNPPEFLAWPGKVPGDLTDGMVTWYCEKGKHSVVIAHNIHGDWNL